MFDKKARLYGKLFPAQNDADAVRILTDLLRGDNVVSRHPEDFELVPVFSFEESNDTDFHAAPASAVVQVSSVVSALAAAKAKEASK